MTLKKVFGILRRMPTKKTFKCSKCKNYFLHEERAIGNVCVYCLPPPEIATSICDDCLENFSDGCVYTDGECVNGSCKTTKELMFK